MESVYVYTMDFVSAHKQSKLPSNIPLALLPRCRCGGTHPQKSLEIFYYKKTRVNSE